MRAEITKEEAAALLNGLQYPNEGSPALYAQMKAAGLVAVFGGSDDLMEFRGAVDDEIGASDGTEAPFNTRGLMKSECEDDECPYFKASLRNAKTITAHWCAEPGISWTYQTPIPHATFEIKEDEDTYCRGVVFDLKDAV